MQRKEGSGVFLIVTLALWLAPAPAVAQQKLLTVDDLYHPDKAVDFDTTDRGRVTWIDDATYVGPGGTREEPALVRVDAAAGTETPLLDVRQLEAALSHVPGMAADAAADAARRAARPGRRSPAVFNDAYTALIVTIDHDLYYWQLGSDTALRLTKTPEEELEPTFSPDGRLVAFVRAFNLHVVDLQGNERALTTDGHAQLLNGRLDWLYQEEIYGRNQFRGYWWSPDSARLAFLQLDERPVPEFTVVDHIPYRQELEITDYPKAGDPNPKVRLGVVDAAGGPVRWMDTKEYESIDHLIVNVSWRPDSADVAFQVQDREQTWLDLLLGDARNGRTRKLLRETTKAWVSENGPPEWLDDGSFLWLSERTGWEHLYHYKADGTLLRQVTNGAWEVRTLYGVDEANGWIYFAGTERSHIGADIYRVRLDGSGLTRLSDRPGTHSAEFNPSFTRYVGICSDIQTPPQVRLHAADGREIRLIDRGEIAALAQYQLSVPEFLQVPNRNGFLMEAMLIKPAGFDPSRKYPVLQHTYAGPHAPQVRNAWGGLNHLYLQLLAQRGIVIWVCDNQSASGKGAESAWVAYKRLGETELADIEDGLSWLKQQPWVDPERVGISGWSYGGFMTSYALTHSTSFAMGIAGGSVTDWRDYDSVYTERFMLTPEHNPDGYKRTAPRWAAGQLHGELLLVHGLTDDNVHVQNTVQFAYELQRAGKPFEMMLYPKTRHGVTDPKLLHHLRSLMLDFTLRTLRPEAGAEGTR